MKKRWFGNKKADSKWEQKLRDGVLKKAIFHGEKIPYKIEKTYQPDFELNFPWGVIYIEAKGRFRDREEARKYIEVRKYLGVFEELVFLFMDPDKPMPFAKKRKDGTKFTHGEWATKNGFTWYTEDTIHNLEKDYG